MRKEAAAKNHAHFAALVLVIGLLAACSIPPKPVVRYHSEDPQAFLEHGISKQRARRGHLTFIAGFLEYKPDPAPAHSGPGPITFLIRVEIDSADSDDSYDSNDSDRAWIIDPEDFRIALSGQGDYLAALDPEALIRDARKDIDAEAERAERQLRYPVAEKPLESPLQMLAGYLRETPEERERRKDAESERETSEAWEEFTRNKAVAEAEMRETVWSASALRKTRLAPSERIEGRVGFAPGFYFNAPDSLLLQFRMADGSWVDLGWFGRKIK